MSETQIGRSEPDSKGPKPKGYVRWLICGLLFLAVALSYIDRLVISVLKPELAARYHWSETGYADMALYFQMAYGIAFLGFGLLIDRLGARLGYILAMVIWTIGHMLQAAFTTTGGMIMARLPLAIGEAGTYPAALVATKAWFPKSERALAIGILNAGANIGAIITPIIVPLIALSFGWRMAFIATGALSIIWLVLWYVFYRQPQQHKWLSQQELNWITSETEPQPQKASLARLLAQPQTWAYMCGRFLIDPVWWTFLFWLPSFFAKAYGVKNIGFGPPLIIIYLMADMGSILGGFFSSQFLKSGQSLNRSRKSAMFIMACIVLPVAFVTYMPNMWLAVVLIGLACAGHQGFSTNLFTIPGDLFPSWAGGTISGLGGLSGALGGMLMAKFAGLILQGLGSYSPIFMVCSVAYFAALIVVQLFCKAWDPVRPQDIIKR